MRNRLRAARTGVVVVIAVLALAPAQPAVAEVEGDVIGIAALPRPDSVVFPVRGQVGWGEGAARYGADRGGRMHEGQDLFAPAGTPLVAVRDAVVLEAGDGGGRGNYVALYSAFANETYVYMHMLRPTPLRPRERIQAGDRVGRLGCTGSCWGDHLHFEVRAGRGSQAPPRSPIGLLRSAKP